MIGKALLLTIGYALSIGSYAAPSAKEVFSKASPSIVVIVALDEKNRQIGSGSGVVVERGKVVTNWHVIERAASVSVKRKDVNYTAQVLSDRRDRDLALLSVQGLESPPVSVSSIRTVEVGQAVYAVGAPAGLDLTLTNGLVSALRDVDDGKIIQTSAPISPGSSGGGLFNEQGQLIGITTFKGSGKAMEGLGFAVPSDWVVQLVNPDRKIETKSVWSEWGWFAGLVALVFILFFGRRTVSALMDRFMERRQAAVEEISDQVPPASPQNVQSPTGDRLPDSLLQYAKSAREELSQGQLEPSIWKKAETFSNGDAQLAQQLYIRFRAASLEEADSSAVHVKPPHASAARKKPHHVNADSVEKSSHKRTRALVVIAVVAVLATLFSIPLIIGIAFQREVESLFASSNVTTKFIASSIETYNRSWLKADFVTSHRIDGAKKSIYVRHSLRHIPAFHNGIQLIVSSQIDSERSGLGDAELSPLTRDHLPKATTTIKWGGQFSTEVQIKDLEPTKQGDKGAEIASWRGVRFVVERSGRNSQTAMLLGVKGLSFENPKAKKKAGCYDVEVSVDNSEVIFGDSTAGAKWNLTMGGLLSSDPRLGTTKWGKTKISFTQTKADDVFNGELSGAINDFSVSTPSPTIEYSGKSLTWKIEANRLSASALKNWPRYFLSESDPQFLPISAALPQLLKYSPTFEVSDTKIDIKLNQVSAEAAVTAKLSFDTKELSPETSTADEYMQRADFSSTVSVSKILLPSILEAIERSNRITHLANLEKRGEQYSEAQKSSYIEEAKTLSEAQYRETVEQGFLIEREDRTEAEVKYSRGRWTVNGHDPEALDPKTVEKKERETAIARTRQMSDTLRSDTYSNQVAKLMQWRNAGKIKTSRFEPPLDFQDISLAKAMLQRSQVVFQSQAVIDALSDREVWWVEHGVFRFFLPNVTNQEIKGVMYELDPGGDCRTRGNGPFIYRLFEFDPPIPPAGLQIVSVPLTDLWKSMPKGRLFCGTLVSAW